MTVQRAHGTAARLTAGGVCASLSTGRSLRERLAGRHEPPGAASGRAAEDADHDERGPAHAVTIGPYSARRKVRIRPGRASRVVCRLPRPPRLEPRPVDGAPAQVDLRDAPGVGDVVERVGVEHDEVGALAGGDGPQVVQAEDARPVASSPPSAPGPASSRPPPCSRPRCAPSSRRTDRRSARRHRCRRRSARRRRPAGRCPPPSAPRRRGPVALLRRLAGEPLLQPRDLRRRHRFLHQRMHRDSATAPRRAAADRRAPAGRTPGAGP